MVSTNYELNKKEYEKNGFRNRILHNRRERNTINSIFKKENNVVFEDSQLKKLKGGNDIENYFKNEEILLKEKVKEKTKRKSQIDNLILETVISISNDEEIEKMTEEELKKFLKIQMEKYVKHFLNVHKVKVYHISLHLDEGHIKDGKEIKNIHIHFIHSNVNENGKSFLREIYNKSNKGIDKLQDEIRDIFNLKRGLKGKKRKHLNHKEYKKMKQEEEKLNQVLKENQELKLKNENLLNENEKLKKENQELKVENKAVETLKNENKTLNDKNDDLLLKLRKTKKELENRQFLYELRKKNITRNTNLTNEQKKTQHKENKEQFTIKKEQLKTKIKEYESFSPSF